MLLGVHASAGRPCFVVFLFNNFILLLLRKTEVPLVSKKGRQSCQNWCSLITKTEKKSGLMYSDAIPLITSWQNSQIKRNLLYSGLQLILWALWASVRFKIVIIFPILVGNAFSETARTHFTCKTAAWILFSLSFFLHYIIHRHTLQAC